MILCSEVGYHLWYYSGTAPLPNILHGTKCNTMFGYGITVTILRSPIPNAVVIPLCTAIFVVPNVIITIGLILVTAPNEFPDSLFISPLCAHAVFERSTDRECRNPSGTSSNGRGDSLEQICQGVSYSKTRTLRQQLIIIHLNVLV